MALGTKSVSARVVVTGVAVAAVFVTALAVRPTDVSEKGRAKTADERPSPIGQLEQLAAARAHILAAQNSTPQTPVEAAPLPEYDDKSTDWAVIAATYRDYEAAQARADSIRGALADFACSVYPARGEGTRYYVVVGSGLRRSAAERLREHALSSGLPRDTYVTKLGVGRLHDNQVRARTAADPAKAP